jgi:hypothetical protein
VDSFVASQTLHSQFGVLLKAFDNMMERVVSKICESPLIFWRCMLLNYEHLTKVFKQSMYAVEGHSILSELQQKVSQAQENLAILYITDYFPELNLPEDYDFLLNANSFEQQAAYFEKCLDSQLNKIYESLQALLPSDSLATNVFRQILDTMIGKQIVLNDFLVKLKHSNQMEELPTGPLLHADCLRTHFRKFKDLLN